MRRIYASPALWIGFNPVSLVEGGMRDGCVRSVALSRSGGLYSVYDLHGAAASRLFDTSMRSDARQNRERLLDVTVDLILEVGAEPNRDAIAHRAQVGIGTVYRHFPHRQLLLNSAARHVLERTIGAGEAIVATDADGIEVIRQYLHAAIDHGIGAVNMIHSLLDDTDWPDLQARADALMAELIARGRRDLRLAGDLAVSDIALATIRFGRPLAIGLPPEEDRSIAHRQLDRYVDGLCVSDLTSRARGWDS